MKRFLLLIIGIVIFTTACGSSEVSKTEEALRAEVEAEMAEEAAKEEALREEIKAELEAEGADNESSSVTEASGSGSINDGSSVQYIGKYYVEDYELTDTSLKFTIPDTFNEVEGTIIYDYVFIGGFIFWPSGNYLNSQESYKFTINDIEVMVTPPQGMIPIDESYVKEILGSETAEILKNEKGSEIVATCNVSNYTYYTEGYEVEAFGDVHIVRFEAFNTQTESDELKTFDEVYSGDLIVALDYFNNNLEKFPEDNKVAFAEAIVEEYENISQMPIQGIMVGDFPEPEKDYEPMYPVLDDGLYAFYSFTTSKFNLSYFETFQTEMLDYYTMILEESSLFTIAMSIYADSGFLQSMGFVPMIKEEAYEKFIAVIDVVGNDRGNIPYLYNMEYTDVDSVVNSKVTYPNILMHNFDEVLELKDQETWKTNLYLPVNVVKTELDVNDDETTDQSNDSDTIEDDSLSQFTNETLYSSDEPFAIDYSEYALVVVPMQESINLDKLKPRLVNITETGNESVFILSVFGRMSNVSITYTENGMDSSAETKEIYVADSVENECLLIAADMPNDFSSIQVSGLYQFKSGIEGTTFQLNDAMDSTSYEIFTVKLEDLYSGY